MAACLLDLANTPPTSPVASEIIRFQLFKGSLNDVKKNLMPSPEAARETQAYLEMFQQSIAYANQKFLKEVQRMAVVCLSVMQSCCTSVKQSEIIFRYFLESVFRVHIAELPEEVCQTFHPDQISEIISLAIMTHATEDAYTLQQGTLNWRFVYVFCRNFNSWLDDLKIPRSQNFHSQIPEWLKAQYEGVVRACGGVVDQESLQAAMEAAENDGNKSHVDILMHKFEQLQASVRPMHFSFRDEESEVENHTLDSSS